MRNARTSGGGVAKRAESAFVLVDFQEKLAPHISGVDSIRKNLARVLAAAGLLGVPIVATEQYPKGLGPTDSALAPLLGEKARIEKISFSCFGESGFSGKLKEVGARTLVLGGIEAHICVLQTALHALQEGYEVHILSDAVGSRDPRAADLALDRMRQAGAVISSVEMALYEWMERAGSPEFKQIQALLADKA